MLKPDFNSGFVTILEISIFKSCISWSIYLANKSSATSPTKATLRPSLAAPAATITADAPTVRLAESISFSAWPYSGFKSSARKIISGFISPTTTKSNSLDIFSLNSAKTQVNRQLVPVPFHQIAF